MTRPTTAMELRVAKALCGKRDPAWEWLGPARQALKIEMAKISIRAMYEPTEEMIKNGDLSIDIDGIWGGPESCWQCMINAASPADEGE